MELVKLLETLERIGEFEEDFHKLKYDTAFYVQEKPTPEMLKMLGGGTAVLPSVRISTRKVIEAILEHLELRLDYAAGRHPQVVLRKREARDD